MVRAEAPCEFLNDFDRKTSASAERARRHARRVEGARRHSEACVRVLPFAQRALDARARRVPPRFLGTLAPARRASESPIAMACFRLFTRLPERPERSSPRFISCSERSTFFEAFGPYFRGREELPRDDALRFDDRARDDERVEPRRAPRLLLLLEVRVFRVRVDWAMARPSASHMPRALRRRRSVASAFTSAALARAPASASTAPADRAPDHRSAAPAGSRPRRRRAAARARTPEWHR